MAGVTVPVHAPVIDWIVQNIREDQIAPNVLNQLNAWKTGEKQPTLKQLEAMSKKHIFHSATSCCKRRPMRILHLLNIALLGVKNVKNRAVNSLISWIK